jgi:hypothetical protein
MNIVLISESFRSAFCLWACQRLRCTALFQTPPGSEHDACIVQHLDGGDARGMQPVLMPPRPQAADISTTTAAWCMLLRPASRRWACFAAALALCAARWAGRTN